MRPAQGFGGGFGIRWDLRLWSTRLAILTFVLSVLAMGQHHLPDDVGIWLGRIFFLSPADVKHGMVWQLLTYAFVVLSPWSLLFAVYTLLAFGSGVEERIGSDGFLGWFFGLAAVGSITTVLLSLFWKRVAVGEFLGADAVSLGLLVVWVSLHRGAMINLFMVAPVRAEVMIYFAFGMLVLYSISTHPAFFIPDYAMFFAAQIATRSNLDLSPRRLWLRWRAHRIEQELRKRSSKFTVISGGDEPDDDEGTGTPGSGGYLN